MDRNWVHLTTARLELRPFTDADAAELLRIFQNSAVRHYLLYDVKVTQDWVEENRREITDRYFAELLARYEVIIERESEVGTVEAASAPAP